MKVERTMLQWLKEDYVVRDEAEGIYKASENAYGRCHCYWYYSQDEVEYDPPRAKEIRKKLRQEAKDRKAEEWRKYEEWKRMYDENWPLWHTTYQWQQEGRKPKPDAKWVLGEELNRRFGGWLGKGSDYYYCHIDDTEEIDN